MVNGCTITNTGFRPFIAGPPQGLDSHQLMEPTGYIDFVFLYFWVDIQILRPHQPIFILRFLPNLRGGSLSINKK